MAHRKEKTPKPSKKPRRPQWKKLVLLICACLTSLLLGELAARLLLEPPEYIDVRRDSGAAQRLAAENQERALMDLRATPLDGQLYVDTPTGRRLRANTTAVIHNHRLSHRDITIETNSLGYRNREIGPKKDTRVLFLGDSIVFGDYLDEAQTFVRLVETLSRHTSKPLETINAGVGAIGLENELAILVETGLTTDPDVVVLCFYINDIEHSRGVRLIKPPRLLAGSQLVQHFYRGLSLFGSSPDDSSAEFISPQTLEAWRREVLQRFPPGPGDLQTDPAVFNTAIQQGFLDWGVAWSEHAWERMRPSFLELKRLSRIHGFQLLLAAFPIRPQVIVDYDYDYPQQKLREVAGELKVSLLDFLPLLRKAHRESGEELFFDLCHHTAYANRLIAGWTLAFLHRNIE